MSLLSNAIAIPTASTGYNLTDSVRLRSSASAYLSRTPTSAGNRKTWTYSVWFKRGASGDGTGTNHMFLFSASGTDEVYVDLYQNKSRFIIGGSVSTVTMNNVFRDYSAWYHYVVAVDTTQATASDRVKIWVNGTQVTSFSTANYPALNATTAMNNTVAHAIGKNPATNYFDGYMTEINLIDGQQLTASDFGEYDAITGVWKPKKYTGTYGTNGFYLPMKATTQASGFNTVLYTGTGTDNLKVDGVGFSPDFVWIKSRDGARSHMLYDTVRGATNRLASESTTSELSISDGLKSFDTNGFTLGTHANNNTNGEKNVAWCWEAGGTAVANTDGDIASQVSANTAKGFSVVSYTGDGSTSTVGHGLSSTPELLIFKDRDAVTDWAVSTTVIDSSHDLLYLNKTDAKVDITVATPTASVFTVNNSPVWNNTSQKYIAYCFHSVSGFSKFGSYTGNGTSQSINLGFRPAFVMWKRTDAGGNSWIIKDNTRTVDNSGNLFPNATTAENTDTSVTFTDTGFDVDSSLGYNGSGRDFIYMAFADTRDYQWNFDASGNKNNWTPGNINSNASSETSYDIMSDVPTLTDEDTGNFCTINAVNKDSTVTLVDGNLQYSATVSGYRPVYGTMGAKSGKWYMEMKLLGQPAAPDLGWFEHDANPTLGGFNQNTRPNLYGVATDGTGNSVLSFNNTSTTTISSGTGWATNDIIGCAIDMDNKKIWFHRNGTWYPASSGGTAGNPSAGTNPTITYSYDDYLVPRSACYSSNYNALINFGQRPFAYTPPTGYKKLNTYNLPDSAIKDGSQYMEAELYTGDGTSPRNVLQNGNFIPDLVWIKRRSATGDHWLFDTVRGSAGGALGVLFSNLTDAEYTGGTGIGGNATAFTGTGVTTTTGSSHNDNLNGNGITFVGWKWRASDSAPVSNTAGTITSTVSANTTSGFSIVTYTGTGSVATVGHGLGSAPKVIAIKNRTSANSWPVYHSSLGNTQLIVLDLTNAASTSSVYWNNTSPTTSVFTIGTAGSLNTNTYNYVAYCFAEVEGFSKFGSYTGNGSTDGPFIYTGFRPAFLLYKRTDTTSYWVILDTKRNTYNFLENELYPNASLAEGTAGSNDRDVDFLVNGFKARGNHGDLNASGGTYIYMAFASNPLKHSLAR